MPTDTRFPSPLVPLNGAMNAALQSLGHRFTSVRLVTLLSPSTGRVEASPASLQDLLTGMVEDALGIAGPGGAVVIMTERVQADNGLALPSRALGGGDYALVAVSAIPAANLPTSLREAGEGAWLAAAGELGGGAWVDVEPGAAVALNVLLPVAAPARIRLPRAAQPRLRHHAP